MKRLTFETFETREEAEQYIKREHLRKTNPTRSDYWKCWVVWHRV